MRDIAIAVISALLGGSGLLGIFMYLMKKYIDKKMAEGEKRAEEIRQFKLKKAKCDEKIQHAQGRLFFWIHKAIVTGTHNGDLERAFESLQQAEKEKKELEQDVIARYEQKTPR